ncbi:MAG: porin family protein [Bacteroidota bacterium]
MIRRIILLIALIVVLNPGISKAQRIMGAVIFGTNATQVDGDEVFGYHKFGFNAGLAAIVPFGDNWSVSVENVFSQKGAHQRKLYLDSLDGSYDLKLNYLDVPVLIRYTDKDIVTFGAGMSWGRLVGISEQRNGYNTPGITLDSIYRTSDLNVLLDVNFRVIERLRLNVRYAYSIRPIANRDVIDSKTGIEINRDQYNGMVTLRLYYVFNERISRESRKQVPKG